MGRDGQFLVLVQKQFSRSEDAESFKNSFNLSTYRGHHVKVELVARSIINPGVGEGYYDLGQGGPGRPRGSGNVGRGRPAYQAYQFY